MKRGRRKQVDEEGENEKERVRERRVRKEEREKEMVQKVPPSRSLLYRGRIAAASKVSWSLARRSRERAPSENTGERAEIPIAWRRVKRDRGVGGREISRAT